MTDSSKKQPDVLIGFRLIEREILRNARQRGLNGTLYPSGEIRAQGTLQQELEIIDVILSLPSEYRTRRAETLVRNLIMTSVDGRN